MTRPECAMCDNAKGLPDCSVFVREELAGVKPFHGGLYCRSLTVDGRSWVDEARVEAENAE